MPLLWNLFYPCHTCTWSFPHAQENACIFCGYDYIFLSLVLILPVTSGQDLREGDSWASFTTGWQWCFPLALQLTAQASQVQRVPHWNLKCLVVTGVDDLFFLFFICLDSCGRNSAGAWQQHSLHPVTEASCLPKKKMFLLVPQHCQLRSLFSWKPHPRARFCLTSELG